MDVSFICIDESSDDASISFNRTKTKSKTIHERIIIDSSDDEYSDGRHGNCADKEIIVLDSSSDDDGNKERKKKLNYDVIDKEFIDEVVKLNLSGDDGSAWIFDREKSLYRLDSRDVVWPKLTIPVSVFESLYQHQKIGVQWAASLHSKKMGGILGDDMGLGKTWTSLVYLGGLMKSRTISSALVVAPVSILRSWEKEARKVITSDFVKGLEIHVLSSQISRQERLRHIQFALDGDRKQYLIITSYGLVSNEPQDFVNDDTGFDYVILDEAHKIKNSSTQVTMGCRRICTRQNTRRLLLTGTPIQNNLKEMWVLFDFATSGKVLGPFKRFKKNFADPIELGRNKNATQSTVETAARANSKLQEILKPFFLQRLKKDILLDMPPKQEFVVWTHLSSLQRNLYEDYVANGDIVNSLLSNETKSPLVAINWLRMLIGHPLLIDKRFDRELSTLSNISVERLLEESVKLKVLAGLLKALSMAGHRTLIFSNSTMTLDIIQRVLNGFKVSRIDGKTKERDRQQYVEDFNRIDSSINVMLLSTKAGGLGLTLIGADRVIIFNPSWNPTDDSQAVDRCYRIGQKKPVEVYRFIAAGTVEEKAYEKQIFKDGINRVVTNISGNSTERYFDQNDLKKLFHLSPKGKCEFLEKLQKKSRLGNINSSKHSNFFEQQEGVIGLSRHDAVYQDVNLDENSVSMTPFSGSTPYKVIGKARKALLGESSEWDEEENNKSGRMHKGIAASIKKPISDANFLNKFEISKVSIYEMKDSGRKNEALGLLLDMLDDQENVNKEQRIWMHREIATIGYSLGLLSK